MKRILIDYTYYQSSTPFHGGGEYGDVILKKLASDYYGDNKIGYFYYKDKENYSQIKNVIKDFRWKEHSIENLDELGSICSEFNYDTVYSPLPYSIRWSETGIDKDINFICTVHGLRGIEIAPFKEAEKHFWGDSIVANCSYDFLYEENKVQNIGIYEDTLFYFNNITVITVSEHSKYAIYQMFPQLQNINIEVCYSPLRENLEYLIKTDLLLDLNLKKDNYALITSGGIWYKNALRAAMAYDKVFDNNYDCISADYKLVITGVKNVSRILDRLKNKDKFLLLGYVKNEELKVLIENAHLLFYPSLNEGFGYPPLEAMSYGTLCACSVNSSISEVCGDMVWYFNPFSIDEMINRILQSFDENLREKKRKAISRGLNTVFERQKEDLEKIAKIILG